MNCLKHSDFFGSNLSEIEKFLFSNPGEASCVQKEEMDLRFHLAENYQFLWC